jgi:hypothetical protein
MDYLIPGIVTVEQALEEAIEYFGGLVSKENIKIS